MDKETHGGGAIHKMPRIPAQSRVTANVSRFALAPRLRRDVMLEPITWLNTTANRRD